MIFLCFVEQNQGGESSHLELGAEFLGLAVSAVDTCHIELVLMGLIKLLPNWSQSLAVATPWGEKLNEIRLVSMKLVGGPVDHFRVKVLD